MDQAFSVYLFFCPSNMIQFVRRYLTSLEGTAPHHIMAYTMALIGIKGAGA